jgi:D-alanyl-D-alanine carboxypeptidase
VKFGVQFGRVVAVAVSLMVAGGFLSAPKTALAAKYSSIVIDAQTGEVVSEYSADLPNYPASLTKMMTLYLTFDALERKQLTLDQRFTVSAHAAAQEPTKLDLVTGETVAIHDLILGLVTQSANDAAVVLAEGLAGSETAFADRMTRTARAMGMENTTFHNASGLPNPAQRTTARDLAMLARHLYLDFPREYQYFATEDFKFRGVTYSNHNHLMSSFEGMDGIKTGFIRASGFNLAASAVRNQRRLIGVVMGGQSAHARDIKMASLLNAAFDGRALPETQMVNADKGNTKVASNDTTLHKLAHRARSTLATLSPIGRAEAATPPRRTPPDRWAIQVGAFKQQTAASRASAKALSRLPEEQGKPLVSISTRGKSTLYQARVTNLTEKQAQNACRVLRRSHQSCTVIAPSVQMAAARGTVKNLAE